MARPAFGVTFDDAALAEDLTHASAPGRVVALDAVRTVSPARLEVEPTERRRAPAHTMGVAVIAGGRIAFELHVVR